MTAVPSRGSKRSAGARGMSNRLRRCASPRPTTWRPATAVNATPIGWAISSTSRRPVSRAARSDHAGDHDPGDHAGLCHGPRHPPGPWPQRDLLPGTHLLDSGYVDADFLVTAQRQHQIDVVGPPLGPIAGNIKTGQGYDLQAFVLDWEAQQARCPQGHTSVHWRPGHDVSGDPVIRIRFDGATCRACPTRRVCTAAKDAPRQLTVRPASPPRGDPGRAATPGDSGVQSPVCAAGRGREQPVARDPAL